MNKGDLIDAVAAELKVSKAEAGRVVETVLECIARGLQGDAKVNLVGFGTFTRREIKPRTGVNPTTLERIEIKATTTCGFRPSSTLKERLETAGAPGTSPPTGRGRTGEDGSAS